MGTAQIINKKNKCFSDEMLPENITYTSYTIDNSSHQLFDNKLTSSTLT